MTRTLAQMQSLLGGNDFEGGDHLDGGEYADGAMDGGEYADGAMDGGEYADGAMDGGEYADGAMDGGEYADGAMDGGEQEGGIDSNTLSKTTKRLTERLYERRSDLIKNINEFITNISKDINNVALSVDDMAKEFGKEIKINSDTLEFLTAFDRIKQQLKPTDNINAKLYQSLLEINMDDVNSREVKQTFIDNLNYVISTIQKLGNGSALKSLSSAIESMKRHIDIGSDKMKNIQESIKLQGGAEIDMINELFSTAGSKINISAVFTASNKLDIASKKLRFFKDIAVFRTNLYKTTSELKEYTKSYPDLVGQTIANAVSKIKNDYAELINQVNDNKSGLGLEIDLYNSGAKQGDKISKEQIKMMYQWQCDARVGLYKTIEALDLYLYHFTDSVAKNIDAVSDLHKMLTATKIIAKWYDMEAGKSLVRVFESFKPDADLSPKLDTDAFFGNTTNDEYNKNTYVLADLTQKIGTDNARMVFDRCKAAVEGVTVLKNIISYFVSLGEKYGDKNSEKHLYMSPNIIYKNLVNYMWASAFSFNLNANQYMTNDNQVKQLVSIENTKISLAKVNSAVDPTVIGMQSNKFDILKLKIMRAQSEINQFKNTYHALDIRGRQGVHRIVNSLFAKFVTNSDYFTAINSTLGVNPATTTYPGIPAAAYLDTSGNPYSSIDTVLPANGDIGLNVDTDTNVVDPAFTRFITALFGIDNKNSTELAMTHFHAKLDRLITELWNKYTNSLSDNVFLVDDTYFIMVMKAIAGKILTVVGINRLFKQPSQFTLSNTSNLLTNKTRLILGGVVEDVQVIPDAAELYVRLPLLVEFYYRVFDNGNSSLKPSGNSPIGELDNEQIAYVPEVGSIWSKLILIIFERSKYIQHGLYTRDNIANIVSEVNLIYKNFKNSTNKTGEALCTHILGELVSEVNRRYGVIKKQELVNYYKIMDDAKKNTFSESDTGLNVYSAQSNDYDILDDSNEYEKNSPSDKFLELKATLANKNVSTEEKISKLTDYTIIKEFRSKVNGMFTTLLTEAGANADFSKISLRESIRELSAKLKNTESRDKQYSHIIDAIEKSYLISTSKIDTHIMFHELVVAPLNILNKVYQITNQFISTFMYIANQIEQNNLYTTKINPQLLATPINKSTFKDQLVVEGAKFAHDKAAFINSFYSYETMNANAKTRDADVTNTLELLFIESLVNFSNSLGMLVKLNITASNNIILDISELQKSIEYSLANIKTMSSKFRGLIDDAVIDGYTKTNEGSIYWLESNLLATLFNKVTHKSSLQTINNFDMVIKLMPDVSKSLLGHSINKQIVSTYLFNSETNFDANKVLDLSVVSNYAELQNTVLFDIFKVYDEKNKVFIMPSNADDQSMCLVKSLVDWSKTKSDAFFEKTNNFNTLLIQFNTMIYEFINQTYDLHTKKFYSKLIEQFVVSGFPEAINNGESYPDICISSISLTQAQQLKVKYETDLANLQTLIKTLTDEVKALTTVANTAVSVGFTQAQKDIATKKLTTQQNVLNSKETEKLFLEQIIRTLGGNVPDRNDLIKDVLFNVPVGNSPLSSIIAYTCNSLLTRTHPITNAAIFKQSELTEVSPSMLEIFKVKLPLFSRVFKLFIERCKVYRRFLFSLNMKHDDGYTQPYNAAHNDSIGSITLSVNSVTNGASLKTNTIKYGKFNPNANLYNNANKADLNKNIMISNIDQMINGMRALVNDIDKVFNEVKTLDDSPPIMFDIRKNFTKDYISNSVNNDMPFAPFSTLTGVYYDTMATGAGNKYVNYTNLNMLLPVSSNENMKMLYAMRVPIVAKTFSLKDMPYMKSFITKYNGFSQGINKIDESKVNAMFGHLAGLYHMTIDHKYLNGIVSKLSIPTDFNAVSTNTYQRKSGVQSTLLLIEGLTTEENKSILYKSIANLPAAPGAPGPGAGAGNANTSIRDKSIVVNLIDMNIMPININSLMREIPMSNIYNYSITFDELVSSLGNTAITNAEITSAAKMFLKYPYKELVTSNTAADHLKENDPQDNIELANSTGANAKTKLVRLLTINFGNLGMLEDVFTNIVFRNTANFNEAAALSRLNTKLSRNIIFLTLMQLLIRTKVKEEIEFINTAVVSNTAAVSNTITDAHYDNTGAATLQFDF